MKARVRQAGQALRGSRTTTAVTQHWRLMDSPSAQQGACKHHNSRKQPPLSPPLLVCQARLAASCCPQAWMET